MHSSRPPGGHRSTSVSSCVYVCEGEWVSEWKTEEEGKRERESERPTLRERERESTYVFVRLGFPLNRWPAFFPLHLTNVSGSRRPSVRVCAREVFCEQNGRFIGSVLFSWCVSWKESLCCCHWNMSARVCFFSRFKCWLIVTRSTCLAHDCVEMFC